MVGGFGGGWIVGFAFRVGVVAGSPLFPNASGGRSGSGGLLFAGGACRGGASALPGAGAASFTIGDLLAGRTGGTGSIAGSDAGFSTIGGAICMLSVSGTAADSTEGAFGAAILPAGLLSRCRIRSAYSFSSELEWVFFSVIPTSASTVKMTPGLTSSSRASSLIRILPI